MCYALLASLLALVEALSSCLHDAHSGFEPGCTAVAVHAVVAVLCCCGDTLSHAVIAWLTPSCRLAVFPFCAVSSSADPLLCRHNCLPVRCFCWPDPQPVVKRCSSSLCCSSPAGPPACRYSVFLLTAFCWPDPETALARLDPLVCHSAESPMSLHSVESPLLFRLARIQDS